MTELLLANPTLLAIALVGILFALGDASTTRKRRHLHVASWQEDGVGHSTVGVRPVCAIARNN